MIYRIEVLNLFILHNYFDLSLSLPAGDANRVSNQMKDLEAETAAMLEEVKMVKGTIARTLTAWDSYCDTYSSLQAWLEQGTQSNRHGQQAEVCTCSTATHFHVFKQIELCFRLQTE